MFQTALAEQHRIVADLDGLQARVGELTALQDATQAELDALLPSVLDRAFRGELNAEARNGQRKGGAVLHGSPGR